ncbi:SIS domain-containing protein [Rhizobium tubonense]|uniref:Glucosamine-fructose-6-phosphate aminotransferase n=1 Tax=Rhizobium tubonense TaxID=484088 RepID=A0A2W4CWV1_9HYPH|nr:SIS domain-containing protein [Rhizobium tubonense]PZM15931.1 glucosamine-fructose-6-phosphate aminotransferase [Rhizobium tubonense]
MNVTERVIFEQFPFWTGALSIDLPKVTASKVVVVGCGTSFYLAQTIAAAFNLNGRNALAVPGAEWSRRRDAYLADQSDVCVIALSRSGESTETVQAVEVSRAAGLPTIALTCEKTSSITRAAETVVYLQTHAEEGIVMTSSASLMLIAGLRMAGVALGSSVIEAAKSGLAAMDSAIGDLIKGRSHFVYLGAGPLYGMATEGSLKLQEMSISYSQSFHPMEYRHGPISLVDDKTLAVMLYSADTRDEEAKVADDIKVKGAVIVGLGGPGDLSIPAGVKGLAQTLAVLPALQIIGERVAEAKKIDTTAPRHLNKVVVLG